MPDPRITGIILCGGEGTRLGTPDKGLHFLGDRPMVQYVRESLAPQVARVIISANRSGAQYGQWGDQVVPDEQPHLGPLGGLLAALEETNTPLAFCCPGDAPFLSRQLVRELVVPLEEAQVEVAYPELDGTAQHLFLLLRTSMRDSLRHFLEGGGRTVRRWLATTQSVVVTSHNEPWHFLNVNTPADYNEARAHLIEATHS